MPEFDQRELLPVTVTELFEELSRLPIRSPKKPSLVTIAPLLITMLLPLPLSPTLIDPLLQSEPSPVTVTELFEELSCSPICPPMLVTLAPLLITMLLPLPLFPKMKALTPLLQSEPVPVTSTELFEELVSLPMVP